MEVSIIKKQYNSDKYNIFDNNINVCDKNKIKESVLIDLNCTLRGNFKLNENVQIKHFSYIEDSTINKNSVVFNSVVESSVVGENCLIGPFAHIRPNSKIMDNVKIGNFVEIKNSTIGKNSKVSHMSYVGDAVVGENCNIGCGVIFANYNGKQKNKIVIGNNCFIGSNCNLIAPLNIADNTYICAGTTVTKDTNINDFVIGRCREVIKPNRATKYYSKEN